MSSMDTKPISRIAIVGVGQVGAAAAYALILGSIAGELLLVDVKTDRRDSQVRDLSDVIYSSNSRTRVRAATYREASQCDIVVITAGSKYSIGETSIQHMYQKIGIIRTIVNAMRPFRSDTVLLVVANPVDLLTSLAQELSGLPALQVIGSGTCLDSMRLRGLLADKVGVSADSINLYILGVQGDSEVVAWSTATVGGVSIDKLLPPITPNLVELENGGKSRSQRIIQVKGAIPLGIGSTVYSICSYILLDKRNVLPISYLQPEFGCCFSLPAVLGRNGIIRTIEMPLSSNESADLVKSAKMLRGTIEQIKEDQ